MKNIYLLLECSGEYEDYIEYPLKAFTSKERAAEAKKEYERQKEMEQEQYRLCLHCPIMLDTKEECHCSFAADVIFDPEEGVICPHEVWYESSFYKIITVELEE